MVLDWGRFNVAEQYLKPSFALYGEWQCVLNAYVACSPITLECCGASK